MKHEPLSESEQRDAHAAPEDAGDPRSVEELRHEANTLPKVSRDYAKCAADRDRLQREVVEAKKYAAEILQASCGDIEDAVKERDEALERAEKAERLNVWYEKRCQWYQGRTTRLCAAEERAEKAEADRDRLQREVEKLEEGEPWHDLPEKIARLREERDGTKAANAILTQSILDLRKDRDEAKKSLAEILYPDGRIPGQAESTPCGNSMDPVLPSLVEMAERCEEKYVEAVERAEEGEPVTVFTKECTNRLREACATLNINFPLLMATIGEAGNVVVEDAPLCKHGLPEMMGCLDCDPPEERPAPEGKTNAVGNFPEPEDS